jgi:hypothetical protein
MDAMRADCYNFIMFVSSRLRACVSVIAAYALALQTILSVLAIAVPAHGIDFSALCTSAGSPDPGSPVPPAKNDCPACCLAGGCAAANNIAGLADSFGPPFQAKYAHAGTTAASDLIAFWPSERPATSRAPPV